MLAEISGLSGVSSEIEDEDAVKSSEHIVNIVRLDIRASNICLADVDIAKNMSIVVIINNMYMRQKGNRS